MLKNDRWISEQASLGMLEPFQEKLIRHLDPESKKIGLKAILESGERSGTDRIRIKELEDDSELNDPYSG